MHISLPTSKLTVFKRERRSERGDEGGGELRKEEEGPEEGGGGKCWGKGSGARYD